MFGVRLMLVNGELNTSAKSRLRFVTGPSSGLIGLFAAGIVS